MAYVRNFVAARIAWRDEQLGYQPTAIGIAKRLIPSAAHLFTRGYPSR